MPLRLTGKERTCRARASGRATPDLRRKPDKRFSSRLSRKLHRRAASGPLLHADMAPKWVPFERRLTLWFDQPHDARVSDNPDDPHFSLSFGGEAFFVVGLHPGSSRPARRFERPALVFNLHDQFEQLRAQNRYEKLRDAILDRDFDLAGSINPMLARHGEGSEARQYSGRAVGKDWACPYAGRGTGAMRAENEDFQDTADAA